MVTNEKNAVDEHFEDVENTLGRTERYVEENQKSLLIIIVAIFVIVGGYLAYAQLYVAPMEKNAQEAMFMAERYFEKDSFNVALNGDGNNEGFLSIIDNYGATKAASLASYYSGVCYLKTGKYEEAINHFKDFSSNDDLVWPLAIVGIGDAYLELGKTSDAITHYKKAVTTNENEFSTPIFMMKLAFVYELDNEVKKALGVYEDLKANYSKSNEAAQVEKYIARLNNKQ